jgi:hypothetical protein
MSLQTVLAEIKKAKVFADEDTNGGEASTLNARRGRKNQAIEQLKVLKRDYKQQLIQNTVFIIATGSERDEFSRTATELGLFVADPEAFYKDLAGRVPEVLYKGKEGVSNIFDVLGRHLEDKMMELDINEYNQLLFKAQYAQKIDSVEDFAQLIKKAINDQIGSEIVGVQAIDSLVDQAIERSHAEKYTPVVLTTNDEAFALQLSRDLERLTTRVFMAVAGEGNETLKNLDGALVLGDATQSSVKAAIKEMRKNLKK